MLVLTRRVGEEIVIDGQIRVAVVHVRGKRVRLGIEAPRNVRVERQELSDSPSVDSPGVDSLAKKLAVSPARAPGCAE